MKSDNQSNVCGMCRGLTQQCSWCNGTGKSEPLKNFAKSLGKPRAGVPKMSKSEPVDNSKPCSEHHIYTCSACGPLSAKLDQSDLQAELLGLIHNYEGMDYCGDSDCINYQGLITLTRKILSLIEREKAKAVREARIDELEKWRDWLKHDPDSKWLVKEFDNAIANLKDESLTNHDGIYREVTDEQ